MSIKAYAAKAAKGKLEAFDYEPGPLGEHEVEVAVTHCGICHSDISMLDNEWGMTAYPFVPGHEVVGKVMAIGNHVKNLKIGDRVGIGWLCGSCAECEWCARGKEHLCAQQVGTIVQHHGGYADRVRSDAKFAMKIPDALDSASAGPLMCAGCTVYTPLVHQEVRPEMHAAVIGIGGLGHLALQFLNKMGCHVTAISSSRSKEAEAKKLGAHDFLATGEANALQKAQMQFDVIVNTVSGDLPWDGLINTLRPEGKLIICGVPANAMSVQAFPLIGFERKIIGGRLGSPGDTEQMLEFAARHGVKPMIEEFAMKECNAAVDHARAGKARYRAVLVA